MRRKTESEGEVATRATSRLARTRPSRASAMAAATSAAAPAASVANLGIRGLPLAERHAAIRDVAREDEIVGDDERRPTRGLAPDHARELCLARGVDAARRLVEDENVRVGDEH